MGSSPHNNESPERIDHFNPTLFHGPKRRAQRSSRASQVDLLDAQVEATGGGVFGHLEYEP